MMDVMESMGLRQVFNFALHVPALRVDEMVKVLRHMECFSVMDIPQALDLLTSISDAQVRQLGTSTVELDVHVRCGALYYVACIHSLGKWGAQQCHGHGKLPTYTMLEVGLKGRAIHWDYCMDMLVKGAR